MDRVEAAKRGKERFGSKKNLHGLPGQFPLCKNYRVDTGQCGIKVKEIGLLPGDPCPWDDNTTQQKKYCPGYRG